MLMTTTCEVAGGGPPSEPPMSTDPMSALRSATRRVRDRDRSGWGGPALMAEAEEIASAIRSLETQLVALVARVERGGHTAEAGAAGTALWLERSCGVTPEKARSLTKTARFANEHPATGDALDNGDVELTRVEAMAHRIRGRRDALYSDHEKTLLGLAAGLSHRDFVKALRHWAALADDVLSDREHMERHGARRLHISTTMHGMVIGEFLLKPTEGQHLVRALDALSPPDAQDVPGGPRTLPQRRADALTELASRYLAGAVQHHDVEPRLQGASADGPSGVRAASRRLGRLVPDMALNVMVDLETLQGGSGLEDWAKVRCEVDGVGPVGRHTIERIACNNHLRRVIVDPQSNVINQGRATRFATPTQRAALVARDGGCIGCGRPSQWTEVHHIYGWVTASGRTNLDEMVLVCQRCHTLVHEGRWHVVRTSDGRFAVVPPEP